MNKQNVGAPGKNFVISPDALNVLREISVKWDILTQDDFNPVMLALELLDNSSPSRDINEFSKLLNRIEKAMDLIVNDNYQAFNKSIETFSKVVDGVGDSVEKMKTLKHNLHRCQSLLHCKRTDLLELWIKSVQFKEMIKMLDTLEELRHSPENIEKLIQDKFYFNAVKQLLFSLKTINGSDYSGIGALVDIKSTLNMMKSSIHETIIEDLHRVLFLKHPKFSEAFFQKQASIAEFNDIIEDLETNPEENPSHFISVMLLSLDYLGKLQDSAIVIKQRLPLELYKTSESVIQEVEQKWGDKMYQPDTRFSKIPLLGLRTKSSTFLLEALMKNLYQKFFSILEVHKFAINSFKKVLQREDSLAGTLTAGAYSNTEKKHLRYSLHDLWNVIQSEIKSLLVDYLHDFNAEISSTLSSEAFKVGNDLSQKSLFKFSESQKAMNENQNYQTDSKIGILDKLSNSDSCKHKLLIQPSVFNISVALKPTFEFVSKVEKQYGFMDKRSEVVSFLDETLLKLFLPQVEDMAAQRYHESINGIDSFRTQTTNDFPVFKSAVMVLDLIKELSLALYQIPIHQKETIRIIQTIVKKYFEKCSNKIQAILMNGSSDISLASALWASNEEVIECMEKNASMADIRDVAFNEMLSKKQMDIELKLKQDRSLQRHELINDPRTVEFLANMHSTLDWFVNQVGLMRKPGVFKENSIEIRPPSEVQGTNFEFGILSSVDMKEQFTEYPIDYLKEAIYLCLDVSNSKDLDDLLQGYKTKSRFLLLLLRQEMRCQCYYNVDISLREGSYVLEESSYEPDSFIASLNVFLLSSEEVISKCIPFFERKFIFDGLALLISYLHIYWAKYIRQINNLGAEKILKNIRSVQQCLSTISMTYEVILDNAKRYYNLFLMEGPSIIKFIEDNGPLYAFEEFKIIFDLIYKSGLQYEDHPLRKAYDECISQLKRIMI